MCRSSGTFPKYEVKLSMMAFAAVDIRGLFSIYLPAVFMNNLNDR